MLRDWDKLPAYMQTEAVRPYYEKLKKKRVTLFLKRLFDIIFSILLIIILSPVMFLLSIAIIKDSEGGVFFRQERITQYGRKFQIHKFRTMVANAENQGTQVTVLNDRRVTKIGSKLRKYRMDELPQLIDIFLGDMSFVGTRPEVTRYVKQYTPEMMATLLLPAGITSEASLKYKDESNIMAKADDAERVYVDLILPEKMKYNLRSLYNFNLFRESIIIVKTAIYVFLKKC